MSDLDNEITWVQAEVRNAELQRENNRLNDWASLLIEEKKALDAEVRRWRLAVEEIAAWEDEAPARGERNFARAVILTPPMKGPNDE